MVRPVIKPYSWGAIAYQSSLSQGEDRRIANYPVLHRTGVKVVGDERVELWQRVLDIECFLVKRKGHSLDIERILRLADHVRGSWWTSENI